MCIILLSRSQSRKGRGKERGQGREREERGAGPPQPLPSLSPSLPAAASAGTLADSAVAAHRHLIQPTLGAISSSVAHYLFNSGRFVCQRNLIQIPEMLRNVERDRRLLRDVERDITCSTVEVGAEFAAAAPPPPPLFTPPCSQ